MTRLRLWLARMVLPRGSVVAKHHHADGGYVAMELRDRDYDMYHRLRCRDIYRRAAPLDPRRAVGHN